MPIAKPAHQVFVCASFRTNGSPVGACHKKGAVNLLQYLEEGILDRGINAQVVSTGCFKVCEKGPVMVIQPGNHWYGEVNEDRIDEILDALAEGAPAQQLLLA